MPRFQPGKSGNPNGRPKGVVGIAKLVGGVSELSLQETEVRERFRILNEIYGWFSVVHSQEGFPDFILSNERGDLIRAEVETESRHFTAHKHDPNGCDLIICWINNARDIDIPVLTISVEWVNYQNMKKVRPYAVGVLAPPT